MIGAMTSILRWTSTMHRPSAAPLSLLVLLAACQEPAGTNVADDALRELAADMVNYDMSTFVTAEGIRQAEIHADTAYFFRDSSVVHLLGVEMTVFEEGGAERASVVANRGRMDRRTEVLNAQGDVVLSIPDQNRVIESPVLNYDPSGDRIWSDSATTMREGGRVTHGTCFNSDLEFTNFTVCNIRGSAGGLAPPGGGG